MRRRRRRPDPRQRHEAALLAVAAGLSLVSGVIVATGPRVDLADDATTASAGVVVPRPAPPAAPAVSAAPRGPDARGPCAGDSLPPRDARPRPAGRDGAPPPDAGCPPNARQAGR